MDNERRLKLLEVTQSHDLDNIRHRHDHWRRLP